MNIFNNLIGDSFINLFGSCLPIKMIIKVNNKPFRIIKQLGEGGFSTVLLVKDMESDELYAVKKIYCSKGDNDTLQAALNEAEIMKLFDHENIAKVLDVCVEQQDDGSKLIYIFLDYYNKGSLQDIIEEHAQSNTQLPEVQILQYFLGICKAINELHNYSLPTIPKKSGAHSTKLPSSALEFGGLEDWTDNNKEDQEELVPYAHRDIKPANVMLGKNNQVILMDFGSAERARILCKTRQEALYEQEKAAKFSTMTYRAPELFDVEVGTLLNEAVDIWSLGCLLYALAYLSSPFDFSANEIGGSTAIAVMNGKYTLPEDKGYSKEFNQLIQSMLNVEPNLRPKIKEIIERTETLLLRF